MAKTAFVGEYEQEVRNESDQTLDDPSLDADKDFKEYFPSSYRVQLISKGRISHSKDLKLEVIDHSLPFGVSPLPPSDLRPPTIMVDRDSHKS